MTRTSETAPALAAKIEAGEALFGVIGLGYVGLPLAMAAVDGGLRVLGFDVDEEKVEALGRGESYVGDVASERVAEAVSRGRLEATTAFDRLGEPDAIAICVPTPVDERRDPDMTFVERTVERIAATLRPGQLVVLESTTWPGTTDELVRPILEATGLACGEAFFLAYSPERENPGDPLHTTTSIPRVVGGVDPVSGDLAEALYERIVRRVVRVSSARVAEATKLTENVFRAVNIALVNELKLVYDRMGIDVWEVLDAAETKPFGFMRFDPGPGWGGHCIPIDPFYLAWKAREIGHRTRFVELAGEINVEMPEHVVERVCEALGADRKPIAGSRVLVLGLAFKRDVDDERESPSYRLMDLLADRGAEVDYHDPHVPVVPPTREHGWWRGKRSVAWDRETIASYDAVVISTDHSAVDYRALARWARCVVDTRNAMAGTGIAPEKLWKA